MDHTFPPLQLDPAILLEIIQVQTEIARCGLDLGQVINLVCQHSQQLARGCGAVVEIAEGSFMVYRAASGTAAGQLGMRIPLEGSLSGLCVTSNQSLVCHDALTDARVDKRACQAVGLRSMVVVPLSHGSQAVGVLKVIATEPGRFDARAIAILQLMSGVIAAAMYHASKYDIDQLYHQATHDAMTNLPNRAHYFDRLRSTLALAERQRHKVGILGVDMDGLKFINDTYGHRAGDAAIREIGQRLRQEVRQADLVARIGGDEFMVLLTDIGDQQQIEAKVEHLVQQACRSYHFEGNALPLSVSIGSAIYPDDGHHIETLTELADQAMYQRKKSRSKVAQD
ncbi:diguanylate cyclase [Pseudoduganella sp. FT93W]|uniref:Diguanylate cyclase n=1 Tax=Duganella fentianensis TaxID=2692177 RepID=A0A845HZ70_9BURK|nr:sensor domain-containing diguanylate cyclase [Duganella fentianensis]MYN44845.1 diguanylate cyclase [Duganella fentianensis]